MKWITEVIKANIDADGKLDIEKVEEQLKAAAPEHVVPKTQYNSQAEKLKAVSDKVKEAEATIEQLKKDNSGNAELQKAVDEWKTKAEEADAKAKQLEIKHQATEALKDAKGKDIDYLIFKLGQLELGEDGKVKDLANKVKSLQETSPTMFEEAVQQPANPTKSGFKIVDNALPKGKSEPKDLMGELLSKAGY